jgi:large subunit ribosomal protein L15
MVDRKRKRKNKYRGQRTMGAGNTKNRRGAGCRGGRGKAGTNKHKFASMGIFKPRKYRQKIMEKKAEAIKLGVLDAMLDELVAKGKVTKEGDKYIVERKSGYGKVLSFGNATHKIILKINAAKGAIPKIIKAGGKFEYAKKGYTPEEVISGDTDEDIEFDEIEGEKE